MAADPDDAEDAPPVNRPEGGAIVGIGSSAGGIDALRRLLPLLPEGPRLSYIVVQHLDPVHHSILPEMLGRTTRLPVFTIEDGMEVAEGAIYVIPPNCVLTIAGRRLRVHSPAPPRNLRAPIDAFLISLAEQHGPHAACVILSGTGTDGTRGLRAIKAHGGLALAQAEAAYDGMMRSALATGLVDFVLPLEQISARLTMHFAHFTGLEPRLGADGLPTDYLSQITTLLRARTGHDFKDYKHKTMVRRVQRRMQKLQVQEVPAFIEQLRRDPRELDALLQELLISVTGFFRDPLAFAVLEREVIVRLFEHKGPEDSLRVWVPGCATGEEAYSIGMLLREHMPKSGRGPKLQIFASDIDQTALATARQGRYPASIADDLSAERLRSHFVHEDGSYRVVGDLREICLFSAHNLLRDAPFSRLDLISCRNLLIYLNADLQNRLIPLFHYALREGGALFLGSSESASRHTRLFTPIDKQARIFRRRAQTERRLPQFPLSTPGPFPTRGAFLPRTGPPDLTIPVLAERLLLEHYAPIHVVIAGDGELVHASARTGRFLELPAGAPVHNILELVRPGLRPDLRAALRRAIDTGLPAAQTNLIIATDTGQQAIDLFVHPLRHGGPDEPLLMVVFRELGSVQPQGSVSAAAGVGDAAAAGIRHLEAELRSTRERLQATMEELESSSEELKSSNEELTSMNEEMQSVNEELETSREELQSINEELQTVNSELGMRVDELSRANSDMANLLESTQIATLFLDQNLCVKSFTPAAKEVFHLVESDAGRQISHVRARFVPDRVQEDAEQVLRSLAVVERQVNSTGTDQRFVMRVLPYRTIDNLVDGVVITFTDIARISAAEARISQLAHDLRNRIESLETLLDLVPAGIFITEDRNAEHVQVNRRGARLIGMAENQRGLGPVESPLRLRVDGVEIPPDEHPLRRAARSGRQLLNVEARTLRPDGSDVHVIISATPLFTDAAEARGAIAVVVDISDRKQAEAHRQMLLHELQHRVKNILATVGALAGRMMRNAGSLAEFRAGFLPRLQAMGRMHDLLSQGNWSDMGLRDLLQASLASYAAADGAIILDGPEVLLPPEVAATLGMILHELATNAAKYGALSTPGGRLRIVWSGAPELVLEWRESGVPAAAAAASRREGFGIGFVRRSVEYELAGRFVQTCDAEGMLCRITFSLAGSVDADAMITTP